MMKATQPSASVAHENELKIPDLKAMMKEVREDTLNGILNEFQHLKIRMRVGQTKIPEKDQILQDDVSSNFSANSSAFDPYKSPKAVGGCGLDIFRPYLSSVCGKKSASVPSPPRVALNKQHLPTNVPAVVVENELGIVDPTEDYDIRMPTLVGTSSGSTSQSPTPEEELPAPSMARTPTPEASNERITEGNQDDSNQAADPDGFPSMDTGMSSSCFETFSAGPIHFNDSFENNNSEDLGDFNCSEVKRAESAETESLSGVAPADDWYPGRSSSPAFFPDRPFEMEDSIPQFKVTVQEQDFLSAAPRMASPATSSLRSPSLQPRPQTPKKYSLDVVEFDSTPRRPTNMSSPMASPIAPALPTPPRTPRNPLRMRLLTQLKKSPEKDKKKKINRSKYQAVDEDQESLMEENDFRLPIRIQTAEPYRAPTEEKQEWTAKPSKAVKKPSNDEKIRPIGRSPKDTVVEKRARRITLLRSWAKRKISSDTKETKKKSGEMSSQSGSMFQPDFDDHFSSPEPSGIRSPGLFGDKYDTPEFGDSSRESPFKLVTRIEKSRTPETEDDADSQSSDDEESLPPKQLLPRFLFEARTSPKKPQKDRMIKLDDGKTQRGLKKLQTPERSPIKERIVGAGFSRAPKTTLNPEKPSYRMKRSPKISPPRNNSLSNSAVSESGQTNASDDPEPLASTFLDAVFGEGWSRSASYDTNFSEPTYRASPLLRESPSGESYESAQSLPVGDYTNSVLSESVGTSAFSDYDDEFSETEEDSLEEITLETEDTDPLPSKRQMVLAKRVLMQLAKTGNKAEMDEMILDVLERSGVPIDPDALSDSAGERDVSFLSRMSGGLFG